MRPPRPRVLAQLCALALTALLLACSAGAPATAGARMPSERQWKKDVAHAMAGSRSYLRDAIADGRPGYAINLDVDNTSVASYYAPGKPVRAVRALARLAHSQGVAVLVNSARSGKGLKAARGLLRRAGYPPITEFCGRTSPHESIAHSKQRCRAQFTGEGYTIVANVGNNRTDFSGAKDYGRGFRLPNYGGRLG